MLRRFLSYVLLIILLIGIISYYYFDRIFFPIKFREIIIDSSEDFFNRPVTFDDMSFDLLKGLSISGYKVYDKHVSGKYFISIDEIKAKVFLPSLFKKKVLVTSLIIDRPVIGVKHTKEFNISQWNFSDLITLQQNKVKDPDSFTFIVSNLSIWDGELDYVDETRILQDDDSYDIVHFYETIKSINLKADLSLNQKLNFDFQAAIPEKETILKTSGTYHFPTKTTEAKLKLLKINVKEYLKRLYFPHNLILPDGYLQHANLDIAHTPESLELSGDIFAQKGQIYFPDDRQPRLTFNTFQSKGMQWKWDKQKNHSFSGHADIKDFVLRDKEEEMITGSLQIHSESATINIPASIFAFKGNLLMAKPKIRLEQNHQYAGKKFELTNASFTLNNDQIGLSGKFVGNTALIQLKKDVVLNGDIYLDDFTFGYRNQQVTFNGPIKIDYGKLRHANFKYTSNLNSQNTKLSMINGILKVKTDLGLEPLRVDAPNKSLLQTDTLQVQFDTEFDFDKGTTYCDLKKINIKNFNLSAKEQNLQVEKIVAEESILTYKNHEMNLVLVLDPTAVKLRFGRNQSLSSYIKPKAIISKYIRSQRKVTVEGQLDLINTVFALDSKKQFSGNPSITFIYGKSFMHEGLHNYDIKAKVEDSKITNLPIVGDVTKINGTLSLRPDGLNTSDLTVNALSTKFQIEGKLRNFYEPYVDANVIAQNINLNQAIEFMKEQDKEIPFGVDGYSTLKMYYRGLIKSPDQAFINLDAKINNTSILFDNPEWNVKNINGQIFYEDYKLTWEDMTCNFNNERFSLRGTMENFSMPLVNTKISSSFTDLDSKLIFTKDAIQIARLQGDIYNSYIDTIATFYYSSFRKSVLNAKARFRLDTRDISKMPEALQGKIRDYHPKGVLQGDISFAGPLEDWKKWDIDVTAKSKQLTVQDNALKNLRFNGRMKKGYVSNCEIKARSFGGNILFDSEFDLNEDAIPIDIALRVRSLNLEEWNQVHPSKNDQLAGYLDLDLDCNGNMKNRETLNGSGSMSIRNGFLWRWDLIDTVSRIALIPDFQNDVISAGSADFVINDGILTSHNIKLKGNRIALKGAGTYNIPEDMVNIALSPAFSDIVYEQSSSARKIPSQILTQTDGFLTIKFVGPREDIKMQVDKSPTKVIKKTTGTIINTIKEGISTVTEASGSIVQELIDQNF
jgi:hypothetical protein